MKEDKNGKIDDSDELFDKIGGQLDNGEYDAVVSEILSIPREKWSNKLRFDLVCAYNDMKDFKKAVAELAEAAPLCETAHDKARYNYLRGYICYMNDKEIAARRFYRDAAKIDPEYAVEIKLEEDIADCGAIIAENLAELRKICGLARRDIRLRCSQKADKKKLSDEEFTTRLGFFPAIRILPGFDAPMGFGGYFDRLERVEKEKTRQWFADYYGVTDAESFFEHLGKSRDCNLSRMTDDAMSFIAGRPTFDIRQLTEDGMFAFENSINFVRQFAEYLPRGGISAWDIGEKIGFVRHAYRCGLIGKDDYSRTMRMLTEDAKKRFSSWEEYMCSLIFGAAVFVYSLDDWNIVGAISFIADMMGIILRHDLGDVSWG